jgi:hypothetical protein
MRGSGLMDLPLRGGADSGGVQGRGGPPGSPDAAGDAKTTLF